MFIAIPHRVKGPPPSRAVTAHPPGGAVGPETPVRDERVGRVPDVGGREDVRRTRAPAACGRHPGRGPPLPAGPGPLRRGPPLPAGPGPLRRGPWPLAWAGGPADLDSVRRPLRLGSCAGRRRTVEDEDAPPPRARSHWLAVAAWTVALLAASLVGAIVTVSRLSRADAITLPGGIAIFVAAISGWAVVTTASWWRWSRHRPGGAMNGSDRSTATPRHGGRPGGRSSSCAGRGPPSCSPATTWRKPNSSPTGSSSWRTVGWSRRGTRPRSPPGSVRRRSSPFRPPADTSISELPRLDGQVRALGPAVEVRTTCPTQTLHQLSGWALARGTGLAALTVTRPRLEDVYFELAVTPEHDRV
jgi:hypothetical protein